MRFRLSLLATPLIVLSVGCSGGGGGNSSGTGGNGYPTDPSYPTTPTNPTGPVQTNAVTVGNNFFSPADIQVSPGATVTWTWGSEAVTHNVSFTDGVASSDKSAGGVYTRTFNTAGTFGYSCTLHGGMTGSVLVK